MKTLQDRYRIDSIINFDPIMIRYAAFDMFREQKVEIFELFPSEIVARDSNDKRTVVLRQISDESMFEEMKAQTEKAARMLIPMFPLDHIAGIITFFSENNTVYLVCESVDGVSLDSYVKKNLHGTNMRVSQVKKMIDPMAATLESLHKKGIVHGRISPDLIMIDDDGHMVLTGIGAPMMYVEGINENYSPVEQFAENGQFGPNIDIYAVGALFYRYTTGQDVIPFYERISEDNPEGKDPILEPSRYNGGIMDYQSKAIMKALSTFHFDRYDSLSEFLNAIEEDDNSDMEQIRQKDAPMKLISLYQYRRSLMWSFAITMLILLIFIVPRFFRIGSNAGAKVFYDDLVEKDTYTQCKMIDDLNDFERKNFANDYNQMKEEGEHTIRYYNLTSKRFTDYGSIDQTADHVRYVSLDYRLNGQAILYIRYDEKETDMTITLKETDDGGYYINRTEKENGKVTDSFNGIIHENEQEEN